MNHNAVRRKILELGCEDDIPLWEIADACRTAGLIAAGNPGVDVLAASLLALARTDEIRIRVGQWDDRDTRDADIKEAEPLLSDPRRYSSTEEIANGLERVYYVNVDNIVE